MNRLDLIIDALERANELWLTEPIGKQALAAARELRALKPLGYIDSKGVLFNTTTHPHMHTALYALDEVTK